MAAALPEIAEALTLSTSTTQIAFSVYLLGLAFGPFPIAAFSETFGRRPAWLLSHLWYILWNSLCPVGNSGALMITGRLFSGFGASVGPAVCSPAFDNDFSHIQSRLTVQQLSGPIVADMYGPEKRGISLAIATFAPYLGPALGPIIGGVMAQHATWHWLFWVLSIFDAAVVLVALLVLRETYAPVLRRRHLGPPRANTRADETNMPTASLTPLRRLRTNMSRPFALLCKRPIVQLLGLLLGLNFGVYCVTLSTFAELWIDRYHESALTSSLHYIAIAVGCTIASQGGGRLIDWTWKRLRQKASGAVAPEYRIPVMVPGVVLMPVGLVWYGWSAQEHMSWVMVDAGVVLFTLGSFLSSQALLAYLLDEFVKHAASANAASRVLSYVLGFTFPIFAPQLYIKLGYGWGNTLLALILVVFGWPAPIILWKYGERLRAMRRGPEDVD